ncbi:MAG: hypothetical protein ACI35W_06390 [Anaeroplasmataceae bacterium]
MKNSEIIIYKDNDEKEIILNLFMGKNPHIVYNEKTYEAIKPGDTLNHPSIKNPLPLPKGVYGFIVDDYIFLKNGSSLKILNPGYSIYLKQSKSHNILSKIITAIILIAVLVIILIILL